MKKRRKMAHLAAVSLAVMLPLGLAGCGREEKPPVESTVVDDEAQAALEEAAYQADLARLEETFSSPDDILTMSDSVFEGEIMVVDDAPVSDQDVEPGHYGDFVELGEYKGLPVKKLEDGTTAEEGMTVSLTYVDSVDGTVVQDETDYEIEVMLGSGNSYIEGFEEAIIGHKIGETCTFTLTFSEDTEGDYMDANGEFQRMAGSTHDYEVNLISGWEVTPIDALLNLTEKGSTMISYPKNVIEEVRAQVENAYAGFAEDDEMDAQTFVTDVLGLTEEEIQDTVYHDAKSLVVIRAILEKENISKDSDEMKAAIDRYIEDMGYDSKSEAYAYGETDESLQSQAEFYVAMGIVEKYAA